MSDRNRACASGITTRKLILLGYVGSFGLACLNSHSVANYIEELACRDHVVDAVECQAGEVAPSSM
jgi:hypothetical protein